MSLARSEREQIRINIDRIDRRLEESQDFQAAIHAVAQEQYREQLSLAGRTVISQEMLSDQLSRVGPDLDALTTSIGDVSRGIDALGCMFQWGFDELLCQLELVRDDLREILKTLRRPLETQAKELRRRGFEALSNGWYEEALDDLTTSIEHDYRDFTVHRALATIYVRDDRWKDARSAYEKAAKYARPYSAEIAAECELGASMACRQLSKFEEAYDHTTSALDLRANSLIAHYEHALNSVCLSADSATDSRQSEELRNKALDELRLVLWQDSQYAVRVDTEPLLEPVRSHCSLLLEALRVHLGKQVFEQLKQSYQSIRAIDPARTVEQLVALTPRGSEGCELLRAIWARGSICDLQEAQRRVPKVRDDIRAEQDYILRIDARTRRILQIHEMVKTAVAPRSWLPLGDAMDREIQGIWRLHQNNMLPDYLQLVANAASLEQTLFGVLEHELLSLQKATAQRLEKARKSAAEEWSSLDREAKAKKEEADKGSPAYLGWLFWPAYLGGSVLIAKVTDAGPGVSFLILLVGLPVSLALYWILDKGIESSRKEEYERAKARAEKYHSTEIDALQSDLNIINDCLSGCHRKELFAGIPETIRIMLQRS